MDHKKSVDESWKDAVDHEQSVPDLSKPSQAAVSSEPQAPQAPQDQEPFSFLHYISSLALQAMIFLGEIPNPMSNKVEINLPQARLLIETLIILRTKTKGNLTKEEEGFLNASVYELQMKFVEMAKKEQHG
ncbi:MAG: DUF1844 domain-containing protein [Candidatus Omnitrophica bacterium]|nr:DUF1844 domain-containing protein [Candidatus Omnitrophota bacterium]